MRPLPPCVDSIDLITKEEKGSKKLLKKYPTGYQICTTRKRKRTYALVEALLQ